MYAYIHKKQPYTHTRTHGVYLWWLCGRVFPGVTSGGCGKGVFRGVPRVASGSWGVTPVDKIHAPPMDEIHVYEYIQKEIYIYIYIHIHVDIRVYLHVSTQQNSK